MNRNSKTLSAHITIHTGQDGPAVSPLLYGIFFEEINRAGEGGLWAEMLQNTSFEDDSKKPAAWSVTGPVTASLDRTQPLNDRNPTSLRLDFRKAGGRIANRGFSREKGKNTPAYAGGLALRRGETLHLSLYQWGEVPLEARLESKSGKLLAKTSLPCPGGSWQKAEASLKPSATDLAGCLVLAGKGRGKVWIDHVSLVPVDTWKGHGLRKDLAEMAAAMKPAFVRFPGGCFVEGKDRENALRWKDSIGDPARRRGVSNHWGYKTSGAFGVHEFFQWCEDLGAEPLYVINCGMGQGFSVPMNEMGEWVRDALDLVEYATGPADSPWGALRAQAGHPVPFKMNYLEIGNEQGGPGYEERYALFHDALKAKYPGLRLIANFWAGSIPQTRPVDIQDDHFYLDKDSFLGMSNYYDGLDPKKPKVYVGEYAVNQGAGLGNLGAALGEAVFLNGLEANGDRVVMSSYAPLFAHPAWKAWNPNAIVFDHARSYGTPSYHLQTMYASNRGDLVCPLSIDQPENPYQPPKGRFGVGAWATQAEFKDITFSTPDGKRVFSGDFSKGMKGWKPVKGRWTVAKGALRQTGKENAFALAEVARSLWGDGIFALKARKIGGKEGFQVQFQAEEEGQQRVWNLGGWGNLQHGLQGVFGEPKVPGKIEEGRWYDIRVELEGPRVRCFLDGKLAQEVVRANPKQVYALASRSRDGKDLILKVVNAGGTRVETTFDLLGLISVASKAKAIVLASKNEKDENSFERPRRVVPVESVVTGIKKKFTRKLAAHSVTILRISIIN